MWRRFTDNRAALFLSRAIENEEKQPIMNMGSSALKCNGNWFIYSWLSFESTWNIEKNLHYVILDKRDSRLSVGLWFTFMLSVFMPHSIFMPNKKKRHKESSVLFHSTCEKLCWIAQKALKWFHHQRLAQIWTPLNFHCSRLFHVRHSTTHSWGIDWPLHGSNHSQDKGVEKWHLIVCCRLFHYIN